MNVTDPETKYLNQVLSSYKIKSIASIIKVSKKSKPMTVAELDKLHSLTKIFGNKWKLLTKFFPDRLPYQLNQAWNRTYLKDKRNIENVKLANLITEPPPVTILHFDNNPCETDMSDINIETFQNDVMDATNVIDTELHAMDATDVIDTEVHASDAMDDEMAITSPFNFFNDSFDFDIDLYTNDDMDIAPIPPYLIDDSFDSSMLMEITNQYFNL